MSFGNQRVASSFTRNMTKRNDGLVSCTGARVAHLPTNTNGSAGSSHDCGISRSRNRRWHI